MRNRTLAIKQLYAAAEKSANPRLKRAGLATRITDGDDAALVQVRSTSTTIASSDERMVVEQLPYVTDLNAAGVQALLALASSPAAETQWAAYATLARLHPPEALPTLAKLLDSPDLRFVSLGVGGLARFANDIPSGENHPSVREWKYRTESSMRNAVHDQESLRKNPAIVAFWKQWWATYRNELEK